MSEIIYYTFYARGDLPASLELENGELIHLEKIYGNWWKLHIRLPKDKMKDVVEELKKYGLTPASSANYR